MHRTLSYRTSSHGTLRLFAWGLGGATARPAMLFFHGGGWSGGTPLQFAPFAEALAADGWRAFSAEYRLIGHGARTAEDCVVDARAALRWLRDHAGQHGIDRTRIFAGGGSAGGYLAARLALTDEDGRPRGQTPGAYGGAAPVVAGLALFNPVIDPNLRPGLAAKFADPAAAALLHAITVGQPPLLLLNGEADETTPLETAKTFAAQYEASGNVATLQTWPEVGHAFFNSEPYRSQTLHALRDFLGPLVAADRR